MQRNYEDLYHQLKKVLEKNMDVHKGYLKASEFAKHADVKLFFRNKAYSRSLFNEKLLFELNCSFNVPKIEDTFTGSLHSTSMETPESLLISDDRLLLAESKKDDQAALAEYEELLKNPRLPLSIRFIVKEQVTVIVLDSLKMEQLVHFL